MKKCVYFAENQKNQDEGMILNPGYGFTANGSWRDRALPAKGEGLILDDRYLPSRNGIADAFRVLKAWNGLIVLDFERPCAVLLSELIHGLSGKTVVLPPAYGRLPHEAVLLGPWLGERPFSQWLLAGKNRYGDVVLDAFPLRIQCFPGGHRRLWNRALPDVGYYCPGLGCFHRRLPDGSILFWDSRKTLLDRLVGVTVPRILFNADWDALPESQTLA